MYICKMFSLKNFLTKVTKDTTSSFNEMQVFAHAALMTQVFDASISN